MNVYNSMAPQNKTSLKAVARPKTPIWSKICKQFFMKNFPLRYYIVAMAGFVRITQLYILKQQQELHVHIVIEL